MVVPEKKDEARYHHTPQGTSLDQLSEMEKKERARKFKELMDKWMADESGHDESVWPALKESIEENRMSDRARFGE